MSVSLINGHIDDDVQMTDNEMIERLNKGEGFDYDDIIDLINRQKAEIERSQNIIKVADKTIELQSAEISAKRNLLEEAEAEIERLEQEKGRFEADVEMFTDIGKMYSELKAEAIKEFAERLKAKFSCLEYVIKTSRKTMPVERVKAEVDAVLQNGCPNVIDKILKEMVGDTPCEQ